MPKKRPIGDNDFDDLSDIDPDTSDEVLDNLSSDKDEDSESIANPSPVINVERYWIRRFEFWNTDLRFVNRSLWNIPVKIFG